MEEKTILLVEDNADDVKLTLRVLKKSNVANRIDVAEDGAEALDYLYGRGKFAGRDARNLPQVILLDLKMPKINGIEVLQTIRADEGFRMVPVVVLTTSNEQRDLVDSYKFGANSYVRKPVDFNQFVEAIQQLGLYWLVLNSVPR